MAEVRTSRTAAAQAGTSLQAYREKYRLKIKSSSQNIGFYVECVECVFMWKMCSVGLWGYVGMNCVECNEHSRTFRKVPEPSLGKQTHHSINTTSRCPTKNVPEGSGRFRNLPEASGMFLHTTQNKKVPEPSGSFWNVLSCMQPPPPLISRLLSTTPDCDVKFFLYWLSISTLIWFQSVQSIWSRPLPPSMKSPCPPVISCHRSHISPPSRCVNVDVSMKYLPPVRYTTNIRSIPAPTMRRNLEINEIENI